METSKLISTLAIALALFAAPAGAGSQQATQPLPPITAAEKREAIEGLLKEMRDHYVLTDLAAKAEASIRQHLAAGDYDAAPDGKAFAALVSKDLREACNDLHLALMYSASKLPDSQPDRPLTKEELAQMEWTHQQLNGGFFTVQRLVGNVGYIELNYFLSPKIVEDRAAHVFDFLKYTDALIIDLRNNGGGFGETVDLLTSYFFDKVTLIGGSEERGGKTNKGYTRAKLKGPRYVGKEVFILTSGNTGSAAEGFAYGLQAIKRATTVGEKTWGGANMVNYYRLNDHFRAKVSVIRALNPYTKTNWDGVGVTPDIPVSVKLALPTAHLQALKNLKSRTTDPGDLGRLEEAIKIVEKQLADMQGK